MLFHSSVRRELAHSFGATLLILFTIVITMLLIRTLGLANKGSVNPQEIVLVLTYTVLGRLPMVLTLALFIAIVSTLSRMYRDSEMVIWLGSGQGLLRFVRPVLTFAWPVLLAVTVLTLWVWPWANRQTDQLTARYERRGDLERVAPGQFQESADGRRVFFIDKDSTEGKDGRNVFISSVEPDGSESVTSARAGRIEWLHGSQFLVLEQGQRLDHYPDGGLKISEFARYGIRIGDPEQARGGDLKLKSISSLSLWQRPNRARLAELGWRIGMALTALNFTLLGIAVAAGNPRAGRSGNLAFMLFAFIFYYNLLNVGQNWVSQGLVGFWPLMLVLHGGALALSVVWLLLRHHNLSLLHPMEALRRWRGIPT